MSKQAIGRIKSWRGYLTLVMEDRGLKRTSGRQNEGNDSYLPSVSLRGSRIGECQVYQGPRLPVPPVYLTVECAICQLPFEHTAEKESFRAFVFQRLRTAKSLESKAVTIRNRELKKIPKRNSPFTVQEESQILIDKSIGMTAEQTLRHWLFDGKQPFLADIKRVRGEL